MKNRMNRIACKLAVAAVIFGLTAGLPTPALRARSSAPARAANSPSAALPALQGEKAVKQLKERGLYNSLQEAMAAARYELRWEDQPALRRLPPSYRAPNPAQRLNAYFNSQGLHLAPQRTSSEAAGLNRASDEVEWQAGMRLAGYGYGESLSPVGPGELMAKGNRIEYRRKGLPLTEWYINKAEGIEQGFTIEAPPGVRPEGERLRLAMEVSGELRAELVEEGRAVALKQAHGEAVMRYSGLYAYDARGRALPAEMKVSEGRVLLEVEDAGAVYPVTIDPLYTRTFTERQKLAASDWAAQDNFGVSVAISGDTAVVGAVADDIGSNAEQGSAYVFVRSCESWSQQWKLTASDGAAQDSFGEWVAISGNTVVVGAPYDDESFADQGSAYVFVRSGGSWSQQQKLTASDGAADDEFGHSAAISGETVVVGARQDDESFTDQGSAYVFVRSGGSWSQQQKLTASDGEADDFFGVSVAISGDTVVVGAVFDDTGSNSSQGSAYVFARSGGSWSQQQKLTASDGDTRDYFGASVAISGDTVVVGAFADDIGSNVDQGSAYIFERSGGSWSQQQKLTASDGAAFDRFGSAAISGDTVVVGTSPVNHNLGSVYVFARNGGSWSEEQKLTASDGVAWDRFGVSAAISENENTIVVGAPLSDFDPKDDRGAAYVFHGGPQLPPTLGNYNNASVIAGQTIQAPPSAPPGDPNGDLNDVTVSPLVLPGGSGGLSVDRMTGVVTIPTTSATQLGTHQIRVQATDSCGFVTQRDFFLDVVNSPPRITPNGNSVRTTQGGTLSAPAAIAIATVSDGQTLPGALTVAAAAPAGLTVSPTNSNGVIMATATAACAVAPGSYPATLTVTDSAGATATAAFSVIVDPNPPPTLGNYNNTGVTVGGSVLVVPTAQPSDPNNAMTISVSPTSLPGGGLIGINPGNGRVAVNTGSNTVLGAYLVTVAAIDACGAKTTRSFRLTVRSATCPTEQRLTFVADTDNNRIQRFDGLSWTLVGSGAGGSGLGQFRRPEAVVAGNNGGTIYVADTGNNRIQWSQDGGATWAVFSSGITVAQGLALDRDGNLYVSDARDNWVVRYPGGVPGAPIRLATSGSGAGQVRNPNGLAIDCRMNLYIADTGNNRILRIETADAAMIPNAGTVVAGSGAGLNPAQVTAPQGVAVDNAGDLYVADTGNDRVLLIPSAPAPGAGTVLCASGPQLGQVRGPEGVTIAAFMAGPLAGLSTLVVSDTMNNRIQGTSLPAGAWMLLPPPAGGGPGAGIGQFKLPSKIR